MATIDTVTDSGETPAAEIGPIQPAASSATAAPAAESVHQPAADRQRSMALLVSVFGTVITALIGGMFLFIVSALDGLRDDIGSLRSEMHSEIGALRGEIGTLRGDTDNAIGSLRIEINSVRSDLTNEIDHEIGSLRSEMNARFADADRRFDQIHSVLLDHTDRLARIETTLGISGRPVSNEADTPAGT